MFCVVCDLQSYFIVCIKWPLVAHGSIDISEYNAIAFLFNVRIDECIYFIWMNVSKRLYT